MKNNDRDIPFDLKEKAAKANINTYYITCIILVLTLLSPHANSRLPFQIQLPVKCAEVVIRDSKQLSIMLGIRHINDTDSAFVKEIAAMPGDPLEVQLYFRNMGHALDRVGARISLPIGLELVPNSTYLYNRNNQSGLLLQDDIFDNWAGLGRYGTYNGENRGSGTIRFIVKVSDDGGAFTNGSRYILNIAGHAAGYQNDFLITNTMVSYAAVTRIPHQSEPPVQTFRVLPQLSVEDTETVS